MQSDIIESEGFRLCYLLPGQTLEISPKDGAVILDYVEFDLDAAERTLFDSLPQPQGLYVPPNFSELSMMLKSINTLFYAADKYRVEKQRLQLLHFFYATASGDEDISAVNDRAERIHLQLRQLRTQISNDPTSCKTVAEGAGSVGLSTSRFQYLYKQYFGTSFGNDLIHFRIKRACALLLSTDWTISRIAAALEYDNESYFYLQFKQQMGVTPYEFRRMGVNIIS